MHIEVNGARVTTSPVTFKIVTVNDSSTVVLVNPRDLNDRTKTFRVRNSSWRIDVQFKPGRG